MAEGSASSSSFCDSRDAPTAAPTAAPTPVNATLALDRVTMVLTITLAAGLDVATLSKADYDTVAAKYQASAAAAANIAVDKIERVEFYVDGTLIKTPTQRRDRRAEGEVTMKIIFKESYTEAEAKTAAESFNAAVAAGTVGKVTVILADGQSYETTFESVEVVVDNKSGILPPPFNSAEGLCTTVGVIVAVAANAFFF